MLKITFFKKITKKNKKYKNMTPHAQLPHTNLMLINKPEHGVLEPHLQLHADL